MPNIYQTIDGSPLSLSQVKERAESAAAATRAEYEELAERARTIALDIETLPHKGKDADPRAALLAEVIGDRDKYAVKAKSGFKFSPATGRKVNRYAVGNDTLAAFLAAEDADARAAILAGVDKSSVHTQESAFAPSVFQYEGMRAGWLARSGETPTRQGATSIMLADISAGSLIVPNAARGANSANAEKLTPEQKRDAAAAAMFADLPDADAPEPTESAPD